MRALADAAAEAGASAGVLGAGVEGRALYESLGWRTHAPLTGIVLDPPAEPGTAHPSEAVPEERLSVRTARRCLLGVAAGRFMAGLLTFPR